ncbi:hypothetical protein CEXT_665921 [Caerostris extrusa]|uniref:Uncharacterized protein n=1 Tax=Caerostris extrusa TaxID=172846 RepID=A0AAV4R9N6_CAEEX|nr:hypothetical protein CEXT_665921 [Caerostris extrusa]
MQKGKEERYFNGGLGCDGKLMENIFLLLLGFWEPSEQWAECGNSGTVRTANTTSQFCALSSANFSISDCQHSLPTDTPTSRCVIGNESHPHYVESIESSAGRRRRGLNDP